MTGQLGEVVAAVGQRGAGARTLLRARRLDARRGARPAATVVEEQNFADSGRPLMRVVPELTLGPDPRRAAARAWRDARRAGGDARRGRQPFRAARARPAARAGRPRGARRPQVAAAAAGAERRPREGTVPRHDEPRAAHPAHRAGRLRRAARRPGDRPDERAAARHPRAHALGDDAPLGDDRGDPRLHEPRGRARDGAPDASSSPRTSCARRSRVVEPLAEQKRLALDRRSSGRRRSA